MPLKRSRQPLPLPRGRRQPVAIVVPMVGVILALSSIIHAAPSEPVAIRTRHVELHYRLTGAGPSAQIELWYTRDRAATWQQADVYKADQGPIAFTAPAEGLYGFTLIVRDGQRVSQPPPTPHALAQRWVFIDETPPLAQWDLVEPADNFANRRTLHLRWTAYDDHLISRPVSLWYQSSIDQTWHAIEQSMLNAGRHNWIVPEKLAGQITLKLIVRDTGGHAVERLFGPVPIQRWIATSVTTSPADTTRLAAESKTESEARTATANPPTQTSPSATVSPSATTQPAAPSAALVQAPSQTSFRKRHKANELYRKGTWHLNRGQYALAAERFQEAIEYDQDMLAAINDLAGVHYLLQDYNKALEMYGSILARNNKHQLALRGSALAYLSQRKYAESRDMWQKLLSVNKEDAAAWLDLGDVLFLLGDIVNARAHWRQASKVDRSALAIIQKARSRLELYSPVALTETADASR